ncbi:MAG: glycosyltransferase [Planctomycetes bacterium]|nr:glycosyltransferase [Planctomycetota bacterium]
MQDGADGFQSFTDADGGRFRVAADVRAPLEALLASLRQAGTSAGAPCQSPPISGLRPLKLSARREVYAADLPGLPPLLLKRYPARRGLGGLLRDRVGVRAATELAMAREFERSGLPVPRGLACFAPSTKESHAPSWFVGVRLIGAVPLGTWLEQRFRPRDGAATKFAVVHRAMVQLARMHEAGLWHRDCHGGNLLLRDAEGPAATLWFIDLHGAAALGAVPDVARERETADLLHSLRYACSTDELEALADAPGRNLPSGERVRLALASRRNAHARSRGARAFVSSSRFAQANLASGGAVSHSRSLSLDDLAALIAAHESAIAADDDRVLRRGRRSTLTLLTHHSGAIVAKEFRGRGAVARAQAAFGNGVAAQARDLPVAEPLAVIAVERRRAIAMARAIEAAQPLHLAAHEADGVSGIGARVDAIAGAVQSLLIALIERRFVHPDLSLKNLLLREGVGAPEVRLVDLDAARPGARWSARRLAMALAQLGDLPESVFSMPRRVRFVRALVEATARRESAKWLLRASALRLAKRRHVEPQVTTRRAPGIASTLHVFGNWKWTGPAEPAVALAKAHGGTARLLLGPGPAGVHEQQLLPHTLTLGIDAHVLPALRKHWNPLRTGRAAAALLPHAQAIDPTLIVTHLDGDLAAALRIVDHLNRRPGIIRCVHEAGPRSALTRRLLARADILITPTHGLARELETELLLERFSVGVLETSVDRARFSPAPGQRERGRARLGIPDGEIVFGIVARIQRHRRFELLLAAWRQLLDAGVAPRLVIFGRGTHERELVHHPIRRLGLERIVQVAGYQDGDAYVDALAACDGGLFLVPGSDVSCRAVREWMAMAKPVIAMRRDPLPELIRDGVDGWLVDESSAALARAVRAAADRGRLATMGAVAAAQAHARFDPTKVAAIARAIGRMAALAVPGVATTCPARGTVTAAVRPGRLTAALALAARDGAGADDVVAFDPASSRDALLDLVTLTRRVRPRLLIVEPFREWDASALAAMRRLAPETWILTEPGTKVGSALDRTFPCHEVSDRPA